MTTKKNARQKKMRGDRMCDEGAVVTRVQLSRRKGWKLPTGAVIVSQPTKWGNPFTIGDPLTREEAIASFRAGIIMSTDPRFVRMRNELGELRGKTLACWCKPADLCHADVLAELANIGLRAANKICTGSPICLSGPDGTVHRNPCPFVVDVVVVFAPSPSLTSDHVRRRQPLLPPETDIERVKPKEIVNSMPKSLRIDKKRVAYAVTTEDGLEWGVGIVVEGQPGYRPVSDYGPYEDEARAEGVVERLNVRIGVDPKTALQIVATSLVGPGAVRR